MDLSEKVTILRAQCKGAETLEDITIEDYLNEAKYAILNVLSPYQPMDEVPDRYAYIQIRIGTYLINKRGAEGESRHIEVGTERDFASADIPADLLREITPMCGFPM